MSEPPLPDEIEHLRLPALPEPLETEMRALEDQWAADVGGGTMVCDVLRRAIRVALAAQSCGAAGCRWIAELEGRTTDGH